MVMGDMNARDGDRPIEGVAGPRGVPGMNANGECLIELCQERGYDGGQHMI